MDLVSKLSLLADAAKYDASCASSGGAPRSSSPTQGLGSNTGMGICHSYAPDGRCISLLKILLTNFCVYDCQYCINRRSSDVRRARFSVNEVVQLTLDFYRRNYIEGLFLSSGIIQSPEYTMEQIVDIARTLREVHDFRGYIHLKTIPDVDDRLIELAGRYADRLSVNIELPTADALTALAPEKNVHTIKLAMSKIRTQRDQASDDHNAPRFAPAGQSTQVIVGADDSTDATILRTAETLYASYRLKRVYYSAYSPIPAPSSRLPAKAPPLMREHRLYQADWLMRHYGFDADEIASTASPQLDLEVDPKLAWALAHLELFPVDLNRAERQTLLRIPGIGVRSVKRMLALRRKRQIRYGDLVKLRCDVAKASPFVITADHRPTASPAAQEFLRQQTLPKPTQLSLL
ncbi:MAG: putative DNA modification/repair radical SAM protein [Pseudomonadota bacterium]|nr:putative DNA modification/repair radical SAM protein [Pseudomonadota bacterium]